MLPASELRVPSRLDSILAWSVFSRDHPPLRFNPSDRRSAITDPGDSPPQPGILAAETMHKMHGIYLARVHPSHPIIDLAVLEGALQDVEKNSVGWNLNSCLILLTCALGAISENYKDYIPSTNLEALQEPPIVQRGVAFQYWHMAQKRLGLTMGEDCELAVQCLCLSG